MSSPKSYLEAEAVGVVAKPDVGVVEASSLRASPAGVRSASMGVVSGVGGAEYARKYLRHRRKMFSTDLVRHLIIHSDKKSAGMGVPA